MVKKKLKEIEIKNINSIPKYYSDKAIIVDDKNENILVSFLEREYLPYLWLDIQFSRYKYCKIYNPINKTYKKKFSHKIYNIYINFDTEKYIKDFIIINSQCKMVIKYYLHLLQKSKLLKKIKYDTKNIEKFIINCNTNTLSIYPWYYYDLGNDFIFNFKNQEIENKAMISYISAKRKGGIIETNNVKTLINDNFSNFFNNKTLIIAPEQYHTFWINCIHITYEKLCNSTLNSEINTIIIHECYQEQFSIIKAVISIIKCEYIWIFFNLPITHYFTKKTSEINNMSSISNFWLDIDSKDKSKNKIGIIRMIVCNFHKYYTKKIYSNEYDKKIIKFSKFEKYISKKILFYYHNWLDNLDNDDNNKYSITNLQCTQKIENNINNTIIKLLCCIRKNNEIESYFSNIIKNDKTINTNYGRYISENFYKINFDGCPICYSCNFKNIVQLICGHYFCIKCIINSLVYVKKCPMCNEFIDLSKMAIIEESVKDYNSNIISYIKNLDNNTLLITDNIDIYNFSTLTNKMYIDNPKLDSQAVDKIIIFATSNNTETINQIADYVKLIKCANIIKIDFL